jgi:reverse gyrase
MGLPCRSCLHSIPGDGEVEGDPLARARALAKILGGSSGDYGYIAAQEEELGEFSAFFKRLTGLDMWSIQRSWARRLLSRSSLVLTAPTGSGKSTLVQAYSMYMASGGYRVYMIVPTRELLRQSCERISMMISRGGAGVDLVCYDPSRRDHKGLDLSEALERQAGILITTSALLSRRFSSMRDARFDVIVADDLDSLVKSSKNLERVLGMIGVGDDEIRLAIDISIKKYELAAHRASGGSERISRLREELEILRAELASRLSKKRLGQLVVSTATGKSWGIKSKILREILGFEVGGILEYMRNIVDTYTTRLGNIEEILRAIGPGTIVLITRGYGDEEVRTLIDRLKSSGLRVGLYRSGGRDVKRFIEGELDYIVGKASFYGALVRGLDEPLRIRNAVFIGVPKHIMPIRSFLSDLRSLALFYRIAGEDSMYREIYREARRATPQLLAVIRKILRGYMEPREGLEDLISRVKGWVDLAVEIAQRMCGSIVGGSMIICRSSEEPGMLVPDPMTYIQATGRTSRLYNGSMTLGLSIVIPENQEVLGLLASRLRRYIPDIDFKRLEDLDIEEIKRLQERSRRSGGSSGSQLSIRNILMIVESPTKARTIAGLFGSRSRRLVGPYTLSEFSARIGDDIYMVSVIATMGHIFDLSTSGGLYGVDLVGSSIIPRYGFIRRCQSCGAQYTDPVERCSRCGSSKIRSSQDLVMILRRLATEFDEILIATDPDPEGEKIAWDLLLALTPYSRKIMRAEFHEITRRAVLEAISSPRSISRSLVEAQIIRRLDDRFTGFSISQELQERFSMRWLGAGRVETPALGWVVERYDQYRSSMGYRLVVEILGRKVYLFYRDRGDAEKDLDRISRDGVMIERIERETRRIKPPPPYTTDSLIFDITTRLGISASLAMRIAQDLFETGLITYHRTDSTRVSQRGLEVAREYLQRKDLVEQYSPRIWGDGGAHEAIRPTQPIDLEDLEKSYLEGEFFWGSLSRIHARVYDTIFRRFIASQMREADVEVCKAILRIGDREAIIEGICSTSRSFNDIYQITPRFPEDILKRGAGSYIDIGSAKISRGSTVRLITGGELVRIMKERGVGRPSTYAKAIENNKRHGYIVESKRGYLIPTKLGISVLSYIKERYPSIASEIYTRDLMKVVEAVERGEKSGSQALSEILEKLLRENQAFHRAYAQHLGSRGQEAVES